MTTNLKTYLTTKSDKYHVIVSYYLNGERKQSWISTGLSVKGNNKRKAEEMRKKTEVEWRERLNLNNYSDILFCDYMLKWLENNISLKQNTYKNYEMVIKGVIYPYFHERKIKLIDLKKEDIQSFYKYKIEHDNVSPNTVRKYHSYIRQALQSAVSNERIAYDPSLDIKLPRKIEHKANYYDQIEFKQLLSAVKESKIEAVIMLAALFGLRRSEILGLRWSCIDFEKRTISICATVTPIPGGMLFSEATKTESSTRTLNMNDIAFDYLRCLKEKQEENRIAMGKQYNTEWDGFVCIHKNGDLMKPDYVSRHFPLFCEKCGLRRLKLHELRHTNVSLLLCAGATLKEVQVWVGHREYSTTANIYAHILSESKAKLPNMIQTIIADDSLENC